MNKQPDAIHYTETGTAAVGEELEREMLARELARAMKLIDALRAWVKYESSHTKLVYAFEAWEAGE